MRLISQDGTIDVPYDSGSLTIGIGKYEDVEIACIYYHNFSTTKGTKLAEYKSKKKVEKAMKMLHEKYERYEITCSEYTVNWFDFPKVFQFPKDEDLEVQDEQ